MEKLLNKYVKFHGLRGEKRGARMCFGRVVSVEQDTANIKGIEQGTRERPDYHIPVGELTECSHEEVFKIGKGLITQP